MKKQKDKKESQQEVQKPRRTSCLVWKQIKSQNLKSTLDYEWPKFKTDRERIRFMSNYYKDMSIVEAFENGYNFKSKVNSDNIVNLTPQELHVGQIVEFYVQKRDCGKNTLFLLYIASFVHQDFHSKRHQR